MTCYLCTVRTDLPRAFLLAALILLSWSVPQAGWAQTPPDPVVQAQPSEEDTVWAPRPMGALLRSAILPGWGQLYVKAPIKAGIMAGGETWFVLETVWADRRVQDLLIQRSATSDPVEREAFAQLLEVARRKRSVWLRWSIFFWIFQFTDAYVDAHLYAFDRIEPDVPDVRLGVVPAGAVLDGFMVRLDLSLDRLLRGPGR